MQDSLIELWNSSQTLLDLHCIQEIFVQYRFNFAICDTSKIMYCLTLMYVFIAINIASVGCIIRSPCPIACSCDFEKGMVDCKQRSRGDIFWNKLPNIPAGTRHIRIETENLGNFTGPSTCQNYSEVTILELSSLGMSSITNDALECMPKLQSLKIQCFSNNIPAGLFQHMSSIQNIILTFNHLNANIIPILCIMKQLKVIDLSLNTMSIGFASLHCLGFLEHLSHVILNSNTVSGPITEILQPLRNVSDIISLKYCQISSLQEDTFFGFRVKVLDLLGNNISYVPRKTFMNLAHLMVLDLSDNKISGTYEWLQNLNSLQAIRLGYQGQTEVPSLPANIHKVKFGLLSKNYKVVKGSFTDLHNLEELDLSYSGIHYFESNAFHNLPKLEILDLSRNDINGNSLSNLFLDIAHCPLKILDLSFNPLNTLNDTIRNNLTKLVLNQCKIVQIFPGTFVNLHNLYELDLSNNKIKELAGNTFQKLANLHKLDLSQNSIKELSPNIFQGLTHLTTLNLHNNDLEKFDEKSIGLDCPLTHLNLSYNSIWQIYISGSALMNIDLSHIQGFTFNEPRAMPHDQTSNNYSMPNLPNLSDLSISDSMPVYKPLEFFQILGGIKNLTLSGNPLLRYLPSKQQNIFWVNSSHLERLWVNRCKIKSLVPEMFNTLIHLEVLDLSSNKIPSVHPSAFKGLSSLTELYLHDNVITNVNFESFVYLPHLRLLSLTDNALVCSCNVLWISQAVTTLDIVYIPDQDNLQCNSPVSVENVLIKELNQTLADCENQWIIMLTPFAASTIGILALLGVYIVWHYRWHIRYTLFLAKAGRGRFEEMHDDTEYVYDAFVAYSSEDLPWVKRQLLPNVDVHYIGPGGFKLCLHHRDWLVGVDIADNIVKSIAESRRTILVLSKDFAASYWCRFELAMAHFRLDAEGHKKARLMVIMLNDIPAKLLTPRLIHILSTKSYLPWPKDPNLQAPFWKTLRKSLRRELLYTMNEEQLV